MNIENLSNKELQELKMKIELKLNGNSFSETIKKVFDLYKQKEELDKKVSNILYLNKEVNELKSLGFNTIIYSPNHVGFINFKMPKIKDEYYELNFDYLENDWTNNPHNPVAEDEVKKIKEILKIN
jgi:hypothetical protein